MSRAEKSNDIKFLYIQVIESIRKNDINKALEEWKKVPKKPVNYQNHFILCFLINAFVEFTDYSYQTFKQIAHILVSKEYPFQINAFDRSVQKFDRYELFTDNLEYFNTVLAELFDWQWKDGKLYMLNRREEGLVTRKQLIRRFQVIIWFVSEPAFAEYFRKENIIELFPELMVDVLQTVPMFYVVDNHLIDGDDDIDDDLIEKIKDTIVLIFLKGREFNPEFDETQAISRMYVELLHKYASFKSKRIGKLYKIVKEFLEPSSTSSEEPINEFDKKRDLVNLMLADSDNPDDFKLDVYEKDIDKEEKDAREFDEFIRRLDNEETERKEREEMEARERKREREEKARELEEIEKTEKEMLNKFKRDMLASLPAPRSSSSSSSSSLPRIGEKRPREDGGGGFIDKMFYYFC